MKANVLERDHNPAMPRTTLSPSRKIALAAGILYLLTFVSIPQFALYTSVRDPNYLVGPGPDTGVIVGGILEIIVALTGIGTAVALYPALKRQNQILSMGLIGSRIMEAGTIFAGVVCLMTMVTLRKSGVGTEGLAIGRMLIAQYDWFHLGQNLMPAVDDLLLGYLLYQSRLVPRVLPVLAFIGVPVLLANTVILMFGITGLALTLTTLAVIPIALFEISLGVYLAVKGFKPTPITAELDRNELQ
jgi:hypothetical protein